MYLPTMFAPHQRGTRDSLFTIIKAFLAILILNNIHIHLQILQSFLRDSYNSTGTSVSVDFIDQNNFNLLCFHLVIIIDFRDKIFLH